MSTSGRSCGPGVRRWRGRPDGDAVWSRAGAARDACRACALLKDSARGVTQGRWSLTRVLVVGQLALSVPLLLVAGLFVRSLINLERVDVGYARDSVVLLRADMANGRNVTVAEQLCARVSWPSGCNRYRASAASPSRERPLQRDELEDRGSPS